MNSLTDALAALLLTYGVHSTLLLGMAWLLHARVLRGSAHRDLLWKLAAFGAVLTTTAQLAAGVRLDVRPSALRWQLPESQQPASLAVSGTTVERFTPAATVESPTHQSNLQPVTQPAADNPSGAFVVPPANTTTKASGFDPWSWKLLLVSLWLLGCATSLTLLVRRYARARRRLSNRQPETDPALLSALQQLSAILGVRNVSLMRCDAVLSPVARGRREVCLPVGLLSSLNAAQCRTMLAHELAHLRRRDPLWLAGFAWLEAIFFFQPLNRLARRHFQKAAEQLCDQHALLATNEPLALAQCLAEVARWLRGDDALALPYPTIAESAPPLLDRVQRLLSGVREPVSTARPLRWTALASLLLFGALAPGFTAASTDEPPSSPTPTAAALSSQRIRINEAIARTPQGTVRFAFATRPSVCGTGEEHDGTRTFALQPDRDWWPAGSSDRLALYVWDRGKLMRNDVGVDGNWTTPCLPGVTRVDLLIREGTIHQLALSVSNPAPQLASPFTDLGQVAAPDAIDFLLSLVRTASSAVAERALLAALLVRSGVTAAQLEQLSRDASVSQDVQRQAGLWLATFRRGADPQIMPPPQTQSVDLQRVADLRLPFAKRAEALQAATRNGLTVNELLNWYDRVPDRAMRVELIDWLRQREDAAVRAKLMRIVQDARVLEEQQAALRVLARSSDEDARTFAARYVIKTPKLPLLEKGKAPNELSDRVAAAGPGIVHVSYPARPEVCGSGIDGDGAGMFALLPKGEWQPASAQGMAAFYSFDRDDFTRLALSPGDWLKNCSNGPVHLLIDVRGGDEVELKLAVGSPLRGTVITTELGEVTSDVAVAYLLELAARAGQTIASNAILGAVLADDQPTLYAQLINIASDPSRPERVRQTALHWAALDPAPEADAAIRRNASSLPKADGGVTHDFGNDRRSAIGESHALIANVEDITLQTALRVALDARQPMATRKQALRWSEQRGASPAALASVYDLIEERELKLHLLDMLAEHDEEAVSRKLVQIISGETDLSLQRAARAALARHKNPAARLGPSRPPQR